MQSKLTLEALALVGQQSEIKVFSNGNTYLSFTVAHNEDYMNKETGEAVKKATWINCLFKVKDSSTKLKLEPGTAVLCKGNFSQSIYQDKNKMNQISINLNVKELTIIGKLAKKESIEKAPVTETAENPPF